MADNVSRYVLAATSAQSATGVNKGRPDVFIPLPPLLSALIALDLKLHGENMI